MLGSNGPADIRQRAPMLARWNLQRFVTVVVRALDEFGDFSFVFAPNYSPRQDTD
jgi:hypothetical protein